MINIFNRDKVNKGDLIKIKILNTVNNFLHILKL